jgi:hypothetical protein
VIFAPDQRLTTPDPQQLNCRIVPGDIGMGEDACDELPACRAVAGEDGRGGQRYLAEEPGDPVGTAGEIGRPSRCHQREAESSHHDAQAAGQSEQGGGSQLIEGQHRVRFGNQLVVLAQRPRRIHGGVG